MKLITYIYIAIIFSICMICFLCDLSETDKILATDRNSTSDLQLIARAINRRSKGREL